MHASSSLAAMAALPSTHLLVNPDGEVSLNLNEFRQRETYKNKG
jgi:hypothetical protein